MRTDIRWIRNRVSSLVDSFADQRDTAATNTSPQGLVLSLACFWRRVYKSAAALNWNLSWVQLHLTTVQSNRTELSWQSVQFSLFQSCFTDCIKLLFHGVHEVSSVPYALVTSTQVHKHWSFPTGSSLPSPDRAPGLGHLPTLPQRRRDGRASGVPVSGPRSRQEGHLARRHLHYWPATPLELPGTDWVWAVTPRPPNGNERERESSFCSLFTHLLKSAHTIVH